jgi:hypothetical protein
LSYTAIIRGSSLEKKIKKARKWFWGSQMCWDGYLNVIREGRRKGSLLAPRAAFSGQSFKEFLLDWYNHPRD